MRGLKNIPLNELTNPELIELVKLYAEENAGFRYENYRLKEKLTIAIQEMEFSTVKLNTLSINPAHGKIKQKIKNTLDNGLLLINQ